MTYKQIVDRVKEVVESHKMLVDFGYGNLSDIKANVDTNEADYPYAFLNPTNHTRTGQSIIYRFNLIVMDMVKDEDYLKIQSECQQYIDDILAHLRFHYTDQVDLTLNVALTPFKERFQDVVAGMTATLEIELPARLSDCYSPFTPEETIIYQYEEERPYGFLTNIGVFGGPSAYGTASIINTDYLTEEGSDLDVNILNPIRVRIRLEATVKNLIDQATIDAEGPGLYNDPPPAMYLQTGWFQGQTLVLHHADPWDFTKTIGEEYTVVNEFEIDLAADRYRYQFYASPFDAAIEQVAQWSRLKYTITLI